MKSVDQPTTIKFTTTAEFTPEQWAKWKESLWPGEETETNAGVIYRILFHLNLSRQENVKVTIK
jgi:hypothetical protein